MWADGTGWLLAGFLLANLLILLEVADRLGLKNDLEIARDIQRAMLPQEPFAAHGIEAAGWTRPANTVGGDFYDILTYPDGRVLVALGDVAGKGSPAALLMALLLAMLRTLVQEDLPPAALMERLNRLVYEQTPGSRFITMFLGLFDPATGELTYVNAGQTPPLRLRGNQTERLRTGGIALGMFDAATYDVTRCTVAEGDLILMYSDGITEAERADGTPFDEEGLAGFLRSCQMTPIEQIGPRLFDAVAAYAQNTKFADDLTVLAFRRQPGSKLKWSGVDEIVVERQASRPLVLVIRATDDGPTAGLEPADDLLGLSCYKKILALHTRYRYGHFAVIGPAGEHYQQCYFASVALSTENLLKSGDDKCRWAGRGGMGSIMGAKNLIGIVAECPDHVTSPALEIRALNKEIATGPGSRKFREANRGGLGGTWANYEPLDRFSFVPELNFRPQPGDRARKMYRTTVEPEFVIKAESCFRCGINCHKNLYERTPDGHAGTFRAKFDYEPLNLLSTNIGVDDPHRVWPLVSLVDRLGMDAISLGTTIAYVLDYNERHPDAAILNGARFGEADRVAELIELAGTGRCTEIGHGVKRLSDSLGEGG